MGHHVRLLELTLDGDQEVAEVLGQKLGHDVGVPVKQIPDHFIIFIELKLFSLLSSTFVPALLFFRGTSFRGKGLKEHIIIIKHTIWVRGLAPG